MNKKQDKIIHAPILSLSAKIELFAKFLRTATAKSPSSKKNISAVESDSALKQTIKQVASKEIQTTSMPLRKKKTA